MGSARWEEPRSPLRAASLEGHRPITVAAEPQAALLEVGSAADDIAVPPPHRPLLLAIVTSVPQLPARSVRAPAAAVVADPVATAVVFGRFR